MKYVVTWVIINTVYIPCPTKEIIVDEFGRKPMYTIQTSELCTKQERTPMRKEFTVRDSAFAFWERAKQEAGVEDLQVFPYLTPVKQ